MGPGTVFFVAEPLCVAAWQKSTTSSVATTNVAALTRVILDMSFFMLLYWEVMEEVTMSPVPDSLPDACSRLDSVDLLYA